MSELQPEMYDSYSSDQAANPEPVNPFKTSVSIWLQRTRDIQTFAKTVMNIELMPHQLDMIDALARGKTLYFGRQSGRATAKQVLQAYVQQDGGYIKHFDKTHFTAVTIGDRKFVYCPVGNIVSWSEGDYDHKWCEYCKKHFEEIKQS